MSSTVLVDPTFRPTVVLFIHCFNSRAVYSPSLGIFTASLSPQQAATHSDLVSTSVGSASLTESSARAPRQCPIRTAQQSTPRTPERLAYSNI